MRKEWPEKATPVWRLMRTLSDVADLTPALVRPAAGHRPSRPCREGRRVVLPPALRRLRREPPRAVSHRDGVPGQPRAGPPRRRRRGPPAGVPRLRRGPQPGCLGAGVRAEGRPAARSARVLPRQSKSGASSSTAASTARTTCSCRSTSRGRPSSACAPPRVRPRSSTRGFPRTRHCASRSTAAGWLRAVEPFPPPRGRGAQPRRAPSPP